MATPSGSARLDQDVDLEKHGAAGVIYLQHKLIATVGNYVRNSKAERYWRIDSHGHPRFGFVQVNNLCTTMDV